MARSGCLAGLLAGFALFLAGCAPPQANYSFGLGTTEVRGLIELPPPAQDAGPSLVVAFQYHSLLTGFAGEPSITRQTAIVPTVGQYGQVSVPLPADVVAVDILFISPERLTDTFRFQRQLGVGAVTYTATLPVITDWRSHFYTFLEPQLEHLIVETRYQLSPRDQERLTEWLTSQKRRLEHGKQQSGQQ